MFPTRTVQAASETVKRLGNDVSLSAADLKMGLGMHAAAVTEAAEVIDNRAAELLAEARMWRRVAEAGALALGLVAVAAFLAVLVVTGE